MCGALGWLVNDGLIVTAIKLADRGSRLRDLLARREQLASDMLELSLAATVTLVVSTNVALVALALPSAVLCKRSLQRAQLFSRTRTDPVTGLLNAATWHREAIVEFARAARTHTALAIATVCIDDLPPMTDDAGPPVRDQLVRAVAGMLRDHLPELSLVGRAGSETFSILFLGTGPEEARRICERLRDYVAGEPVAVEPVAVERLACGPRVAEGFIFRLTVSIGVAGLDQSAGGLQDLADAAAAALRQARTTGFSKVVLLPGDPIPAG